MQPKRELTPMQVIENAAFADGLRDADGTGVPPQTQQVISRAIVAIRSRGEDCTIAAIRGETGCGKNTVLRTIRVMEREHGGDGSQVKHYPVVFVDRGQRKGGRQAANTYRPNWTNLGLLCRDEALALFASQLATADAAEGSVAAVAQGSVSCFQSSVRNPGQGSVGVVSGFRTELWSGSQGSVRNPGTEPCFDTDVAEIERIVAHRQSMMREQLAPEGPPLAGEKLRPQATVPADSARRVQERSVLDVLPLI
jgi:hypothetical protein